MLKSDTPNTYGDRIPEGPMLNEAKLASVYVDCHDGVTLRSNKVFTQDQVVARGFLTLYYWWLRFHGEQNSARQFNGGRDLSAWYGLCRVKIVTASKLCCWE